MAERFDYGLGGQPIDHARAHEFYAKARSAGHPIAAAVFALHEGDEWGEQRSLTEAERGMIESARQAGHPAAHCWYSKALMNDTEWSDNSSVSLGGVIFSSSYP